MIDRRTLIGWMSGLALQCSESLAATVLPDWMTSESSTGGDALRRIALLRAQARTAMASRNVTDAAVAWENALKTGEAVIRAARRRTTEPEMHVLLRYLQSDEDAIYSLAAQYPTNQAVAKLALNCAGARKGRASREILNAATFWGRLAEQQHPELWRDLQLARRRFSQLVARQVGGNELEVGARAIVAIERRLIDLAAFNQQFSMGFPDDILLDIDSLLLNMSFGRSLVIYVRYNHLRAPAGPGVISYLALATHADAPITVVPLGTSSDIDALAGAFTSAAADPKSNPDAAAKALHSAILAPLAGAFQYPGIDYRKSLVISPDGALFLTPFSALQDAGGQLLAESYSSLSIVDSPLQASGLGSGNRINSELSNRLVAFGNPDLPPDAMRRGTKPLKEADLEVQQIAALWPSGAADVQLHHSATPDQLTAKARGAGVLHIASHAELAYNPETFTAEPAELNSLVTTQFAPSMTDASLSRSLLVFAPDREGNAYVSALEAAGLDLSHTQLVVLAACDTGGVDWEKGEGVYGLRRAFLSAGAEAVVSTLWEVDDAATRALMVMYYRLLFQREGREQALQHAASLTRRRYPHPHYWAGFVHSGNAGALKLP